MRFGSNCNTTYNFQVERKMIEVGHFSPLSPTLLLSPSLSLSPSFNNYSIVAAVWAENVRVWETEERADFNVAETVEKTGKLLNCVSITHIPIFHRYITKTLHILGFPMTFFNVLGTKLRQNEHLWLSILADNSPQCVVSYYDKIASELLAWLCMRLSIVSSM